MDERKSNMKLNIVEKMSAAKEKAQELANLLNYFGEGKVEYRHNWYYSRETQFVNRSMAFEEVELFVLVEKPAFQDIVPAIEKTYQRVKTHPTRKIAIQEALGLKGEVVEYLNHWTGERRIRIITDLVIIDAYQSRDWYLESCRNQDHLCAATMTQQTNQSSMSTKHLVVSAAAN